MDKEEGDQLGLWGETVDKVEQRQRRASQTDGAGRQSSDVQSAPDYPHRPYTVTRLSKTEVIIWNAPPTP